MQNLQVSEVIEKIASGVCFEATCEDIFQIKILEYGPSVCTAIHDGHAMRESLKEICTHTEDERYFEEDPFTGEFIKSLPITLIANDSRFEYDLNRDENGCVYDKAWGREVWKSKVPDEELEISKAKHRKFYSVVEALLTKLEKDYGSVIVYDIHSYNYQRHENCSEFNIGIENIDKKKYNRTISFWKKQLQLIKIRRKNAELSVNHLFYGRGYFLKHITENFNNVLVLATEVKKVYMDEEKGQDFPIVIQNLAKGLKNAILENSKFFINLHASINVKRKSSLLNSDLQPELIKLDKQLFQLATRFEILGSVNPVNIESEKRLFFKNKFQVNPQFRYKPLTINPFEFRSKVYGLKIDDIDDVHIKQVYSDIINSYADKADMLSNIGNDKFVYSSMRYFGEPSPRDIKNAKFLLYCHELPSFENEITLDIADVKEHFISEGKKYGFDFKVAISTQIASDVLVLNSKQTLVIKKGATFTPSRLNALLNHEVGVHMVTTKNALLQPLKFLRLGLPRNTYTQEGLAIMSEMLSGNLTISRLHTLSLRVLAVKMLIEGYDFKTTFNTLLQQYNVNTDHLYYLVTRVYRGGGFTKDYLYLRGFRRILQMVEDDISLDNLFLGKTNHHYLPFLNEMVDRGILEKPSYKCPAFITPKDTDYILQFLIKSLK